MAERGMYGRGCYGYRESSFGTILVGGLAIGAGLLWAKHQSDQVEKLYSSAGLPYESFGKYLGEGTKRLSGAAREKLHDLTQRFSSRKEIPAAANTEIPPKEI